MTYHSDGLAHETDAELVQSFIDRRDETAFARLVARHGRLVLGTCLRMLRNREDAEDATQAVFLTLAGRASSLSRVRSLAGWLHGVSVRLSLNVRRTNRRWARRVELARNVFQESTSDAALDDIGHLLDEELAELPRRYREVLLLCDLEGHTPKETASRLSVPNGTVSSRLARGRKLLQKRLIARGVTIGVMGLALALSRAGRAAPEIPKRLVDKTVKGARKQGSNPVANERVASLVFSLKRQLMLAKIKGLLCLFGFAVVTAAAGQSEVVSLVGQARGATILYDDFADGSVKDGQPALWTGESATLSVQDESLIISGPSVPLASPSIGNLSNVSVQVQTRLLEGDAVGVAVRRTLGGPVTNYYAYASPNEVGIALGGVLQPLHSASVTFDPRTEDVILQLDVIGDTITYWAWPADETRPATPVGSVTDQTLTSGAVFLWAASQGLSNQTTGRGAFRYVEVADSAIVPEPSSVILASLAAFSLGAWCCFKKGQL